MKKIGIITFHHAKHSYGAFLQAFATLHFCLKNGFDAELINYENKWEQKEIHFEKSFKVNIKMLINWTLRMFVFKSIFDPCRNKKKLDILYGRVSKKVNLEELKTPRYDVVVSGSDQIWNPLLTNGIDSVFFLKPFKKCTKIAYASSMGSYSFNTNEKEEIKEYLKDFSFIGVREKYACDVLEGIMHNEIKNVCDPTFLFTKQEWIDFTEGFVKRVKSKKYILTYFVGGNFDLYWNRIKDIVEATNLPVYNIQSHSKKYKHVNVAVYNILPFELVSLILNASLILTDSFHGTALSINLEKDFIAVINKKNPVRVNNLLTKFGLETRIDNGANSELTPIDYEIVSPKVDELRRQSRDYFLNAIKEAK